MLNIIGAFSGKDYTKVDRSAAYAARWVAKSLVKAGLCRRVLVQVCSRYSIDWMQVFNTIILFRKTSFIICGMLNLQISYAIGIAEPLSICVFSYGTSTKTTTELTDIVKKNFDLRPGRIVKYVKYYT